MNRSMEAMQGLYDRLIIAKDADRSLDEEICRMIFPTLNPATPHCAGDEPIFWADPYYKLPVPRLTASIDAAKEFVAKALPHWVIEKISFWPSQVARFQSEASILECGDDGWRRSGVHYQRAWAEAQTMQHAICAAVVKQHLTVKKQGTRQ